MATNREFTKGEKVHYITTWNDKAKVAIYSLTVYSCGAKQMVLVDAAGTKFAGSNFKPQTVQFEASGVVFAIVAKGLTDAQAEAKALELAASMKAYRANFINEKIARGSEGHYLVHMRKELAEIQADAPAFVWPAR